jgi:hypothetical protein
MGNLVAAQTNGYINKIVVLRSYATLAREIQNLHLPTLDIPGLFLSTKLPPYFGSTSPPGHYSPVPMPTYLPEGSPLGHHSDTQGTPPSPKRPPIRTPRTGSTEHGGNKKSEGFYPLSNSP